MSEELGRTVHDFGNSLLSHVDCEVRFRRSLIHVVHTSEVCDLACTSAGVDTLAVGLFAVLERGSNVDQEEVASATLVDDGVAGGGAALFVWRNRCGDDGSARAGKLSRHPGDALEVLVPVLRSEARLGRGLLAHRLAEQERDGAAALLVEDDLECAGDLVLARVVETGKHDDEALLRARGVGLAKGLHHGTEGR